MKKKLVFISIILALLLFSTTTKANSIKFTDILTTDWYYTAVNYLSNKGIIKGYSDGTFKPNDNITRAEVATILYNYDNHRKQVIDKVLRSSVMIKNYEVIGSGVIVSPQYILTAKHVIKEADRAQNISFYCGEGTLSQNIILCDFADLALIKISGIPDTARVIEIGNDFSQGDEIYLCGNAKGLDFSLTKGIVSHIGRFVGDDFLMQVDAPVNGGNSGGGIFDAEDNGKLIGIVNSKLTGDGVEGIGFGVPINTVKKFLEEVR